MRDQGSQEIRSSGDLSPSPAVEWIGGFALGTSAVALIGLLVDGVSDLGAHCIVAGLASFGIYVLRAAKPQRDVLSIEDLDLDSSRGSPFVTPIRNPHLPVLRVFLAFLFGPFLLVGISVARHADGETHVVASSLGSAFAVIGAKGSWFVLWSALRARNPDFVLAADPQRMVSGRDAPVARCWVGAARRVESLWSRLQGETLLRTDDERSRHVERVCASVPVLERAGREVSSAGEGVCDVPTGLIASDSLLRGSRVRWKPVPQGKARRWHDVRAEYLFRLARRRRPSDDWTEDSKEIDPDRLEYTQHARSCRIHAIGEALVGATFLAWVSGWLIEWPDPTSHTTAVVPASIVAILLLHGIAAALGLRCRNCGELLVRHVTGG